MKVSEKVLNYLEEHDYISTKTAGELGVHRHVLSSMSKKGEIIREKHGLYRAKAQIPDEFQLIQLNSKKMIYSHATALYFHDLSDRTPHDIHISVPQGYNTKHISKHYNNLVFHYVKEEVFEMGASIMKSPLGNDIVVYNSERTLCDIVASKQKMDVDIFRHALIEYFGRNSKNLRVLIKYSKILNVEKTIRDYIEVLS